MSAMRISLLALLAACLLLTACGGEDNAKGPPGSQDNPLVGLPNPSATRTPPTEQPAGEAAVTAKQGSSDTPRPAAVASSGAKTQQGSRARTPTAAVKSKAGEAVPRATTARKQKPAGQSASRPCSLVTRTQAKAIVGAPILEPLEAPQGPTCIYQAKSGKPYITLAVQSVSFTRLRKQIRNTRAISVADRKAYCGTYGKPMLFLPLSDGRVLSIAAPCSMASRFAATAAPHL
jgi:hypothetical protein